MSINAKTAEQMVHDQLESRGIRNRAVLDAMRHVPRERFVPDQPPDQAYADRALPTLAGQTISQPYMVARMSELLDAKPGMKVLEIGTGCGYQTAILTHLGLEVVSIERNPDLVKRAKAILDERYPFAPITVIEADGTLGCPDAAPYDRILVTAAAPHTPRAYLDQLADPGRIVIPLGDRRTQVLTAIDRQDDRFTTTDDVACRFVPLIGEDGWSGM